MRISDINDYAALVNKTAIYPEANHATPIALSYVTLGLNGEAGEVAEKIKKWIRDGTRVQYASQFHGVLEVSPEISAAIQKELGDVAWYWIRIHEELGLDPSETLGGNIEKLRSRYDRDQLGGSGDDR